MSFEQRHSFHFEAAHELGANVASDAHPYARIHGHSFKVTLILTGDDLGSEGWLTDFADVRKTAADLRELLDHRFLNAIEGLEQPTLERIAVFIYRRAKPALPLLSAVEVARPSLSEAVMFRPA